MQEGLATWRRFTASTPGEELQVASLSNDNTERFVGVLSSQAEGGGRAATLGLSGISAYVANGWQHDLGWELSEADNAKLVAVREKSFESEQSRAKRFMEVNKERKRQELGALVETPKPQAVSVSGCLLDRYLVSTLTIAQLKHQIQLWNRTLPTEQQLVTAVHIPSKGGRWKKVPMNRDELLAQLYPLLHPPMSQ
eukprot:TRINITY_DN2908_c0_g1_i4.p1 TRINITY_DN2908_c0_g1~~TRINITY_DN2908_c0_g1_i4.p1  ORF type:complete len:196 (+),score=28.75 TRINITY_DN2908_c0_g1_i4:510-1097(+)